MFCSNCGKPIPDGAKFCGNCGTPVNAPPAFAPPVQAAEPPVQEFVPPVQEFVPPVQEFVPPVQEFAPPAPQYIPQQPVYAPPVQNYEPPAPPKKKKTWIAIVAAVVAVAILAGIVVLTLPDPNQKRYDQAVAFYNNGEYAAALDLFEDLDYEDSALYAAWCRSRLEALSRPTEPSLPTTEATEPQPTEPELTLTLKQAELEYEMTDADVEKFYAMLEEGEALAMSSTDSQAVDSFFEELDDQFAYLESQYGIAMVIYYCDLNNTAASDLYLQVTDIVTDANDAYIQAARRLYSSDCAHKDVLFDDWTSQELEMLMLYTEEIAQLEKRNAEIEVAYQDMQDSATMYDDMVPLYIEMVQNKNRIAQIYGYDNFYDYAYEITYERDYSHSEIDLMRTYTQRHLAGSMEAAMNNFLSGMETLSMNDKVFLSGILTGDYSDYECELLDYLATLPTATCEEMLSMFNGNILEMQNTPSAMEGAFTTNITDDHIVCFFGPGYSNILTVLHEVGHYYGSLHNVLDDIPLDLAETQSQGNEWLFIAWLLEQNNDDCNNLIRDYKLYNDLATILICVIVDEFEQRVYSHPDVASLDGDDLDAIMAEVCENYGGVDYLSSVATDIQNYWRMVVIEQPVYYISYAVSAISAMSIYTEAQNDYNRGVSAYVDVIENIDIDAGFLYSIDSIGLDGPFDEDVYCAITDMLN